MKILHIDSSALGGASVTRQLSAEVVTRLSASAPAAEHHYRDVVANPLAHLDGQLLSALRPAPGSTPQLSEDTQRELALTNELIDELLVSDVLVIGAPMYNFSVPSQLKAWIDRVAQAGRTFRYTANGPEGLAVGKKAVIVSARGGMYAGTAYETALDHQEAYLRGVLGFLGITDVVVIRAEGIAMGPEHREQAINNALAQIRLVAEEVAAAALLVA